MARKKDRLQDMIQVLEILEGLYPEARCALHFENAWQLLVATILSAQCTDRRVNIVTEGLFDRFPDPISLAAAQPAEVEELIRSTGFFRNKAKNLIACAAQVVASYDGNVPCTMEQLVSLPGVGRKTANVVLGNAFGVPGLAVDTHVKRLVRRLGWTRQRDPEGIERALCSILPPSRWTQTSHLLIHHGRNLCKAQRPLCTRCPVQPHCPRIGLKDSR
jgi:endonuclease-3